MKVLMGFHRKFLVLLYLFKTYLQGEIEKLNNECIGYIKNSSKQSELFESLNNSKLFRESNLPEIDK